MNALSAAELAAIVARVDKRMNRTVAKARKSAFEKWLDTFLAEKEFDFDAAITVDGASGPNFMTARTVYEAMKTAPAHEQAAIKNMLVRIDFVNGSVFDYFKHLAKALAI